MTESFFVNCHLCSAPFDAAKAPWCRCLTTEATLVCPHCLTCFCAASEEYRRKFWAGAPRGVWEARRSQLRGTPELLPNPTPAEARRPLVLFVDDDLALHPILARVAIACGCGIIRAEDGRAGLQLAHRYLPDLVLADALMPHMDGRDMCRAIKEGAQGWVVRTVILTGVYKAPQQADEAIRSCRLDDYRVKPMTFLELQALINQHLEHTRPPTDPRRHTRYAASIQVKLTRLESREGEPREEITVTADVGKGGARIRTSLPLAKDEVVMFEELTGAFRTRAAVGGISIGRDSLPHAHLWFLDEQLPDRLIPPTADPID